MVKIAAIVMLCLECVTAFSQDPGGVRVSHRVFCEHFTSSLPDALHDMFEHPIDVGIGQPSRSHLKTIVNGSIEEVDYHLGVRILSKETSRHSLPEVLDCHPSPRHRPSLTESSSELRVKLRRTQQGTQEDSVFLHERAWP